MIFFKVEKTFVKKTQLLAVGRAQIVTFHTEILSERKIAKKHDLAQVQSTAL